MVNDEQAVERELFGDREPSEADSEALLAQYRLFVETSEALVVRRQRVNTDFLSVNSLVLAAAGLLLRDGKLSDPEADSGVITICSEDNLGRRRKSERYAGGHPPLSYTERGGSEPAFTNRSTTATGVRSSKPIRISEDPGSGRSR